MGKNMAKVKMQLLQTMVIPGVEVRDVGTIHEFDKDDVDIYVLCVVGPFHVELVGWCYSTDIRCKENITDLGYGEVYALSQSQLRKFKQDLNDERIQTTAQVPNATAANAVR